MKYTLGQAALMLGLVTPVATLVVFGLVLYWAWSAWVLWNWYAPLAGLPQATFAQVYAYSLLFRCLRGHQTIYAKTEESRKEDMMAAWAGPLFSLGFGWLMLKFLT